MNWLSLALRSDLMSPFAYMEERLLQREGEKIRHIETPPHCWVVLAKPTIGVSTAEVYKQLKVDEIEHPDVQGMIAAIEEKNFQKCVTSSAMYSNLLH